MWRRRAAESPALTPRPGASPGLLRRRYSVPEIVMRKYRLAQMSSDETIQASVDSCSCCTLPEVAPRLPHDRELMRRSALLRRLQGRACRECRAGCCGRATRSLDASHSELRPPSARRLPASGRTSPKRLRLDSRVALSPPSTDFTVSDSSSRVHTLGVSSYIDTDILGLSSTSESDYRDATDTYAQGSRDSTEITTPAMVIGTNNRCCSDVDEYSYSSETCSTSLCTAKETVACLVPNVPSQAVKPDSIDGRISEISASVDNEDGNIFPYDKPLTVETPSYDVLEIVVSESFNTIHTPMSNDGFSEKYKLDKHNKVKSPSEQQKRIQDVRSTDIDEYVSNILVESLNSLSDQLESMNASMGAHRRLSIIEKEIKVKLQNTGVNTIVHLSPTSNNQIIFGHEELCSSDERRDSCSNVGNSSISPAIRDELYSVETNNNVTSAESIPRQDSSDLQQTECFTKVVHSDSVNKAVLQQIQKLFQEDLQSNKPDTQYSNDSMPSISHIGISNVDVYIDNHAGSYASTINGTEKQEQINPEDTELIGSVSTCNYYENLRDNATIPRYSAFPHTESMEVNTSSSDDAEVMGSECTSLVDSLDDPNSPRSIMLRKSGNSSKRSELVRSSIDVLDLLPENSYQTENAKLKEKSESFFVRIKDDSCECDREKMNIVVADHMPETIKQRLYRRHRKRELRMECARRSKVKQLRKELEKQRQSELRKSKKEIEKECVAIMNALISDVISKIAQDEYKCMRIKQKSLMMVTAKSDESLSKKNWKKDIELNNNNKLTKNNTSQSCSEGMNKKYRKAEKYQIRGKLSLQTYPPLTPDDNNSKRIYQKSEIHDGKKCIEILEILEYVNSSGSSPEYSHSDDNQTAKHKKSRIPIPVSEIMGSQYFKNGSCTRAQLFDNRNEKLSAYSPNESQVMYTDQESARIDSSPTNLVRSQPSRHVSVPHCEPRSRSNSLRFKRVFDIIPEERSSFSIESPAEDLTQSRRASAPTLAQGVLLYDNEIGFIVNGTTVDSNVSSKFSKLNPAREVVKKVKEMKSAGTSPLPNSDVHHSVLTQTSCTVMTSPLHKSAATSPIRNLTMSTQTPLPRKKSIQNQQSPQQRYKNQQEIHSYSQQPQPEHHYQQHRQHTRLPRHCNEPEPVLRQHVNEGGVRGTFSRRRSVSSQRGAERLPRCGNPTGGRAGGMASGITSGAAGGASSSSSSSESGGSLLCPLAPAWLQARRRRRRTAAAPAAGQWAVTVAGSCPAALPTDVEMRLRFPETRAFASREQPTPPPPPPPPPGSRRAPLSPPASRRAVKYGARTPDETGRFTLTLKKEASDSSILASKSMKKSKNPLPDVETFRASRSKTKSSVKAVVSDASRLLPTLLASRRRSYTDKGQ